MSIKHVTQPVLPAKMQEPGEQTEERQIWQEKK